MQSALRTSALYLLVFTFLLPISTYSFPALAARTTALLPIQAPAFAPPHLVEGIEKALREEVANLEHARLQMRQRSDAEGPICKKDDVTCFVQLGEKLEVQQLLSAHLVRKSGQLTLLLISYDVPARVIEGKVEGEISAGLDAAQKESRNLVVQLLDPGSAVGSLFVQTKPPGVEVYIDGVAHGKTPLAGPIEHITEGRHLVNLRLNEHKEYEAFIQVQRGTEALLDVQLRKKQDETARLPSKKLEQVPSTKAVDDPRSIEPLQVSPLFFGGGTAMGVGAALLLAAIGTGVTGAILSGLPVTSVKAQVEQAQNVNVTWGTAAALGVASSLFIGAGAIALSVPLLAE